MSWFVCISPTPPRRRTMVNWTTVLEGNGLVLRDVTATPFGKATAGAGPGRRAYLVLSDGTSADVLDRGSKRSTKASVFLDLLHRILHEVPACSVVVHFCRGDAELELVEILASERTSWEIFQRTYPDIGEDVRYTVEQSEKQVGSNGDGKRGMHIVPARSGAD